MSRGHYFLYVCHPVVESNGQEKKTAVNATSVISLFITSRCVMIIYYIQYVSVKIQLYSLDNKFYVSKRATCCDLYVGHPQAHTSPKTHIEEDNLPKIHTEEDYLPLELYELRMTYIGRNMSVF
jgi:hypothetical protein